MSEENKAKVRRFLEEAFGQGKPELVDDLLDANFVCLNPQFRDRRDPRRGDRKGRGGLFP